MSHGKVGGSIGVACRDQLNKLIMLVCCHGLLLCQVGLAGVVEGHADPRMVNEKAAQTRQEVFVVGHFAYAGMKALIEKRALGYITATDCHAEAPFDLLHAFDL